MYHQWCSWGHWGFRVFQHHTPSPRWHSRGWLGPCLHPSSTNPQVCPLYPKPPCGFLCSFSYGADGPPLRSSSYSEPSQSFANQAPNKPPVWLVRRGPTSLGSYTAPPALGIWRASPICSSQGTVNSHLVIVLLILRVFFLSFVLVPVL